MKADVKLVAGNSNRGLAEAIGAYLDLPLTKAVVKRFNLFTVDICNL